MRKNTVFFLSILIITFFLRFYNASDLSGGDDSQFAMLGKFANDNSTVMLFPNYPDEPMSWGGFYYARPVTAFIYGTSISFFGHTNLAIIFPAALFSALSAILLFKIVKIQFNDKVAKIATWLFVFSPYLLAFSRIGLLHSQLIFFALLAFYFLYKYQESKDILYIYLSCLSWLFSQFTTDLRGIVVAVAILPLVYFMKRRKRSIAIRHLVAGFMIAAAGYISYLLIAYSLGMPQFMETFMNMFAHATGNRENTTYLPFLTAIWEMGKIIFLSPFLAIIAVPVLFGIGFAVKKFRIKGHLFWLFYLAPIILFYIQGTMAPGRQVIFMPAFAVFGAIGLYHASIGRKTALLLCSTLFFYAMVAVFFHSIFPDQPDYLRLVFGFLGPILDQPVLLTGIFLGAAIFVYSLIYGKPLLFRKSLGTTFAALVIILNIIFCLAAVHLGIGIYKRTDTTSDVAEFLKTGETKYSCIASVHDKSFTYYTDRICLHYYLCDIDCMQEKFETGEIEYFILDLHHPDGTIGLGKILQDGTLDTENIRTDDWGKNYPEKYNWIISNSVDITEDAIGNNSYFRIRKYIK